MAEVKFSPLAYCKLILHAAKYPHASVNGVLLASENSKRGEPLYVEDVVPLFHMALTLAPMAEVALQQVDSFASNNKQIIAGYYEASEFLGDHGESRKTNRMSYKILENFAGACYVVLHNELLSLDQRTVPLYATTKTDDSGCWVLPGKKVKVDNEEVTLHSSSMLVSLQTYDQLVDFDNHLDCPSKDWTNDDLDFTIKKALEEYDEGEDESDSSVE